MTQTPSVIPQKFSRTPPAEWHTKELIRVGYYPKWRAHQPTPYRNINPEALVRQGREMGATVLEWAIPENHIYLEWEDVKPHPHLSLYPGDLMADLVAAGKKHGVKILVCVPTNAGHENLRHWYEQDEALLAQTGLPRKVWEKNYALHLCPHYPRHRRWVGGYTQELARRYDIDGFVFDGPWFRHQHVWPRNPDGSVACTLCFEAYRQATGREMPRHKDWASPEFHEYVQYFKGVFRGYMEWLTGLVRAVDPNLFVAYNSNVYVWGGWGDAAPWIDADRYADSLFMEMHLASMEELQPILQIKLNRAALAGRAPEMYCKTMDLTVANFAYSRPPEPEVAALAYLTLSEAGIVGIHSSMDENGQPHPERTGVFTDVLGKHLVPRLDYYRDAVPVEHVGVHLSEQTRDYYAGENPSQYLVSPVGAVQTLAESQTTFGLVLDRALTNLESVKNYPVLVLANSACLSDHQVEVIRQYVRDGGCLLATGETSLFDECDRMRKDFSLADVLGVHYAGPSAKLEEIRRTPNFVRYPFLLHDHPIRAGLQDRMITRFPWYDVGADSDRQVAATWADLRPDTDFCCVNGGVEIIGDSGRPMLVAGTFGRGRVVYCAADLTGRYMLEINRHIRLLVASILNWLAPPPVRIRAPKHVHFAVTRQPRASRLTLHFVNILYNNKSANEILGHGFPFDPEAKLKFLGLAPPKRSGRPEVSPDVAQLIAHYRGKHHRPEANQTCGGSGAIYAYEEIIPLYHLHVEIDPQVFPFNRAIDLETGRELPFIDRQGRRELVLSELQVYRGIALEK